MHEPAGLQRRHEATRLAFGQHLDVHYHLDEARVILSLDGDFLGPGPAQLAHARQWVEGRRRRPGGGPARLHVLESTPSLTGAKAERLPASSAEIVSFTLALAQQLDLGGPVGIELPLAQRARLLNVTEELRRAGDRALVVVGEHLPDPRAVIRSARQRVDRGSSSSRPPLLLAMKRFLTPFSRNVRDRHVNQMPG